MVTEFHYVVLMEFTYMMLHFVKRIQLQYIMLMESCYVNGNTLHYQSFVMLCCNKLMEFYYIIMKDLYYITRTPLSYIMLC